MSSEETTPWDLEEFDPEAYEEPPADLEEEEPPEDEEGRRPWRP
ncbi:MAG TPA: hypothetical protein VE669_02395 [Actinomycetota bacterium]|jgi:hypothetical protein|nr:hypothetical protein [Actinomycetota bacterium]